MFRKKILQTIILAGMISIFGSVFFAQTKPEIRKSGSIRGETYSYKYTEQDFAQTPSWNPEEGEPPVSFSRAAAIARSNLPRFVTGAENFKLRRVHLNFAGNEKWFYNFSYVCAGEPCRGLPTRQFSMIVKMDGTILEPKRIVEVD